MWFSILQGQSLSGASFTSLKQLEQHIDACIKAYNDKAEPFVWTKKKVRQRPFKGSRITQLGFRVLALKRLPANLLAAHNGFRRRSNDHESAGTAQLMQLAGIAVRQ